MRRNQFSFPLSDWPTLKGDILRLSPSQTHFVLLDSNAHKNIYSQYDWLAAWGVRYLLESTENSFEALREFRKDHKEWLFGHLSYALKNQVEKLVSNNPDNFGFAPLSFFVPQTVVYCKEGKVIVESYAFEQFSDFEQSLATNGQSNAQWKLPSPWEASASAELYQQHVVKLQEHLQFGNIYEVNYCLSFEQGLELPLPYLLFEKLNETSKAPFAGFYRNGSDYLMCASPERFLQKRERRVIVQPIKGTAPRFADAQADESAKAGLLASEKERAENVMIVDLMRNDLSRTAAKGSVQVEELFGIYSFEAVHQMISTVSSVLDEPFELEDLLSTTFPMGSMTGAPKPKAMELIEAFESFDRSLYSGSIGYIDPYGNCDFNVVIRSFLYNSNNNCLAVRVGSAITILSNPEEEYQECLLKAEKLFAALG